MLTELSFVPMESVVSFVGPDVSEFRKEANSGHFGVMRIHSVFYTDLHFLFLFLYLFDLENNSFLSSESNSFKLLSRMSACQHSLH